MCVKCVYIMRNRIYLNFTEKKYAITNDGHIISYARYAGGEKLRGRKHGQYLAIDFRLKDGQKTSYLIHRLVAEYYVRKPKDFSYYTHVIIHKDWNGKNNHPKNLKWVHYATALRRSNEKFGNPIMNHPDRGFYKLDVNEVKIIKRELLKGASLKSLSDKYGVSNTQIKRIKTGENWGHITV